MLTYHGYLVHQAERPRSAQEQRAADEVLGELASSVSAAWQAIARLSRQIGPSRLAYGRRAQ